jgi:spermidine synthase
MNLFSYFFPQTIAISHSQYNASIRIIKRFGKNELYVNGIQQSGPYTVRLWKTGLQTVFDRPPKIVKNILIFGVGGGTLFEILFRQFPDAHITAIDIDKQIIELYKTYFLIENHSNLTLLPVDAKKYIVDIIRTKNTYDLIIVDLYIGNDVPEFVTDGSFLTSLKRITATGGIFIWNYFSVHNQSRNSRMLLDRLSSLYHRVYKKDILRNVFFYSQ